MAGHRSSDQTLIAVPLSVSFLQELDKARGDKSRSAFVREALYEFLMKAGAKMPKAESYAPSRAGKGGRKKPIPMLDVIEGGKGKEQMKA